jgi:oligoendopeptidase F
MDAVEGRYRAFAHALQSGSPASWMPTFREWDDLRRELETWSALTHVRFTQDTRDERARAALEHRDELLPALTGFDTEMKRRLVTEQTRLAPQLGEHAFCLWQADLSTFDPVVEPDLVAESKLKTEYTQLLAGIAVDFDGETLNLSALARYSSDPDRARRHGAAAARWNALGDCGAELDRIYDELVHLRDGIARKLGFPSFVELGYARMQRVDYDRAAVERYRDAVAAEVVPLANASRNLRFGTSSCSPPHRRPDRSATRRGSWSARSRRLPISTRGSAISRA